jgi:hypothetical protein
MYEAVMVAEVGYEAVMVEKVEVPFDTENE